MKCRISVITHTHTHTYPSEAKESSIWHLHAHGLWQYAHFPSACPLSADVSSVKPDHEDNDHPSVISTKSLAGFECEEMLCCQLEGSGFSPDEWRKGVSNACQRPPMASSFLSRDHSMGLITCHWRTEMVSAQDINRRVFILLAVQLKPKSFHFECPLVVKTSWRWS